MSEVYQKMARKPRKVYRLRLFNEKGQSVLTPSGYATKKGATKVANTWRRRTGGKVNIIKQKTPKNISIIRRPLTTITSQKFRRRRGKA